MTHRPPRSAAPDPNTAPTVFVVDDDAGVRKSLRVLLETVKLAVETYASAAEFLAVWTPDRPGCIVLDLRMPDMSGLELQGRLAANGSRLPIIFITAHGDVDAAKRALKAGAFDFFEKPFPSQEMLDTIHKALEKNGKLRELDARCEEARRRLARLTRRERQVCDRLVAGSPMKAIAVELGMAKKTCDVHRANIFRKMEVATLPELVRIYIRVTGEEEGRTLAPPAA